MKYFARYKYVDLPQPEVKKIFEAMGNVYIPRRGEDRCIIDIEAGTVELREIENAIADKYGVEQVELLNFSKL